MLGVVKYMKKNLIFVFLIVILAVGIVIQTYFLVKANTTSNSLLQYGEFDNDIKVFLQDNLTDIEIEQVINEIQQIDGVNTVYYDARFDAYKVTLVELNLDNVIKEKISKIKNVKKVELSNINQVIK